MALGLFFSDVCSRFYFLLCASFFFRFGLPTDLFFTFLLLFSLFSSLSLFLSVFFSFHFLFQKMSTTPVPSFSILTATVNARLIVLADDGLNTVNVRLASKLTDRAGNVQPEELNVYRYEEVWLSAEDIANPISLCSILRAAMSRAWLRRWVRYNFTTTLEGTMQHSLRHAIAQILQRKMRLQKKAAERS